MILLRCDIYMEHETACYSHHCMHDSNCILVSDHLCAGVSRFITISVSVFCIDKESSETQYPGSTTR